MYKRIYLLVWLFLLSLPAFSQDFHAETAKKPRKNKIKFGVQAGGNLSRVANASNSSFGNNSFQEKNRPGFNAGIFVEVPILSMLRIQPEINFSQKGYKSTSDDTFTKNYNFIDIPLFIKFYPTRGLYVFAGPQLSYLTSTSDTWSNQDPNYTVKYDRGNSHLNKVYGGIAGGIGVDLGKHILFNFGYSSDFTYNYKIIGNDTPGFRNQNFSLRAGYRF